MLTQLIKLRGGRVIGRVSSRGKVELAKAAGADHVIVDRTGDFADEVLHLTDGAGAHVVYDGAGATHSRDPWPPCAIMGGAGLLRPDYQAAAANRSAGSAQERAGDLSRGSPPRQDTFGSPWAFTGPVRSSAGR